jgi:hypothetical protein
MRKLIRAAALALSVAGLAALPISGTLTASAQVPTWPPVISEMASITQGNLSGIFVIVANRTREEHAFVDVRAYLPGFARVLDTYAEAPGANRGKEEGLAPDGKQVGWINHFVRAGQAQGPFIIIADQGGRTMRTWSWLWFSTGGTPTINRVDRKNGNYTSPAITTDTAISVTPGVTVVGAGGGATR